MADHLERGFGAVLFRHLDREAFLGFYVVRNLELDTGTLTPDEAAKAVMSHYQIAGNSNV